LAVSVPPGTTEVLRIEPPKGWVSLQLGDLWRHRELVGFLAWRDVKVRYKQTVLGAAWAILQPLLTMVVFSVIFGRLAGIPSDGAPYPVFAYVALVPWQLFANGLSSTSGSLVSSAHLIQKVYFPRLAIPIAPLIAGLLDFAIAFAVLLVLMVVYGVAPTWNVVWLPALLLFALATCLGVGLWLAALNARYRDVRYVVPFLVQIWMFASPVAYSSSLVPERWRSLYALNPMVGVIDGFRWALLGSSKAPDATILPSVAAAVLLLLGGAWYFRRTEAVFADVL
jgi:lipopolysaccharide transport system permease protein